MELYREAIYVALIITLGIIAIAQYAVFVDTYEYQDYLIDKVKYQDNVLFQHERYLEITEPFINIENMPDSTKTLYYNTLSNIEVLERQ